MPKGVNKADCNDIKSTPFKSLPHQEYASEYFLNSPHKGLLLWWKMGVGKTASSNLTAYKMLKAGKIKNVYVLSPGSLRGNWIQEFCKGAPDRIYKVLYIYYI